jgi:integrase
MKKSFRMFRRGNTYYCQNNTTGKQESLGTKDKAQALRLMVAKNQATEQPLLNLQLARVYAAASDPNAATRTWQEVMAEIVKNKNGTTQERWLWATSDKAFDLIRNRPLFETRAEHFLRVLEVGTISTNVFLRRIHNFVLDMNWLSWPVIAKRQWPPVRHKEKRAITEEEHRRIVAREQNPQWRAFYQLLWFFGGAQSDIAHLRAEDVDWKQHTISYARAKTRTPVVLRFSAHASAVLNSLPREGLLFPRISELHEKHRAKLFNRRCKLLGIQGISLHSYRYSWAERAKICGYPERYAQQALGHASKAVARAYAKQAEMELPSLEEFEERAAKLIPLPSCTPTSGVPKEAVNG